MAKCWFNQSYFNYRIEKLVRFLLTNIIDVLLFFLVITIF